MKAKDVTITLNDWEYECADGCCYDYGTELYVNGELISTQADHNLEDTIWNLLNHLGFKVTIEHKTDTE
jgi:hypothetical protein